MYVVKPKGINIRDNDRLVNDGFLQESINLQWRDGAYRPIPDRLASGITNASDKEEIILHKVSDEDKINVLMINEVGQLNWHGVIDNGVYTIFGVPILISDFPTITDFDALSFTILNGLIYFMSTTQEFYYRLQFNEVDEAYEVKDMYAWKDLIPFYPDPSGFSGTIPQGGFTDNLLSQCGVVLTRFSLVLKTGEEVLHTPIYAHFMYALNQSESAIKKDELLTNIHTIINTNLEFSDIGVFNGEISAINIYASAPYYVTKVGKDTTSNLETQILIGPDVLKGEVQRMAEEPFYLTKTIDKPGVSSSDKNVLYHVGDIDINIDYSAYDISKVNANTIPAGPVMPIDNFSYHKLYGTLKSSNGRIVIDNPKTVLSEGHIRSLSLNGTDSKVGFHIDTEDGKLEGVAYQIDKAITLFDTDKNAFRGLLSYPDSRSNYAGGSSILTDEVRLYKTRGNKSHNLSCAFDFYSVSWNSFGISINAPNVEFSIATSSLFLYKDADIVTAPNPPLISPIFYTSENRFQFSEAGEFSVWPAINSYRVGEGKILFVGDNSVDPANADFIAPLLIGTSDGVYTVNFDPTGVSLIQSITKAANIPALSSENLQIDQSLIYVSDKGLMAINNGQLINLTKDYFPDNVLGSYPIAENLLAEELSFFLTGTPNYESIYPNYNLLTATFPGVPNLYGLPDIVSYMKGAIFAYDGRRDNVWCSNNDYGFSLIFNLKRKQWDMSTYSFSKKVDFFSILNTDQNEIYSRYLVINNDGDLDILSAEDNNTEINFHMLTRPIKMTSADKYKKLNQLISRAELYRDTSSGYLSFGVWGRQDLNKDKVNIPILAYLDDSESSFPDGVRQDIPIGRQKGKYKALSVLIGGKSLPNSSIDGFDIVASFVENTKLR